MLHCRLGSMGRAFVMAQFGASVLGRIFKRLYKSSRISTRNRHMVQLLVILH